MMWQRNPILMTADTVGGVWTYCVELVRGLADRGIPVVLATMGGRASSAQLAQLRGLEGVEVKESSFKLEWMEDPWEEVSRAGDWLLRLAADYQPGIIHLNGYAHAGLPWNAPVMVVAHSCVATWWEAVRGSPPPRSVWQRYLDHVTRAFCSADLVVAPSQAYLESAIRHHGRPRHGRVIHNSRTPNPQTPAARHPIILAAGRLWDEAKNVRTLAQAAVRVSWQVILAGDCSRPDGDEDHFPGVQCLGKLGPQDLQGWYDRASIYALPAVYEPFGLSVLEAAQAGAALVLGDIPTLREIWSDSALYVNSRDSEQLASVLQALIDNPARLQEMGHRARARAQLYKPAAMTLEYVEAYEWLLSQSHESKPNNKCDSHSFTTHSSPTGTMVMPTSCEASRRI